MNLMYSRIVRLTILCLGLVLCASVALAEDYMQTFTNLENNYWTSSPKFRTDWDNKGLIRILAEAKATFQEAIQARFSNSTYVGVEQRLWTLKATLADLQQGDRNRIFNAPASEQPKLKKLAREQKSLDHQLWVGLEELAERAHDYFSQN